MRIQSFALACMVLVAACGGDASESAIESATTSTAVASLGSSTTQPSATTVPPSSTSSSTSSSTTTTTTTMPVLGDELIINGSFESGTDAPDGWIVGEFEGTQTFEWAKDPDGNRYIRMAGDLVDEIWPAATSMEFAVAPGQVLILEFDARTEATGFVFASLNFNSSEQDGFSGRGPGAMEVVGPEWTSLAERIVVPDEAVSATLRFALALNDAITSEAHLAADVDNVSVRRIVEG